MIFLPRIGKLVLAATLVIYGASCERHSWEDTKKLHHLGDEHAADGHGDDQHSEGHGESAEPAPATEAQ